MLYFFDENATPASKIPVLKTILKQHEHLGNQLSLANTYSLLGDFQSEAGDKTAAIDARKNAAKIYADLGQLVESGGNLVWHFVPQSASRPERQEHDRIAASDGGVHCSLRAKGQAVQVAEAGGERIAAP